MAITNFSLDTATYNYKNVISFDYSGGGVNGEVYVDYGSGATLLATINPLILVGNSVDDTDIANVCTNAVNYYVVIKDAGGTTLETSANLVGQNTCIPENVNIDFAVDCNSVTNTGMSMSNSAYAGNSSLQTYLSLRIYRSIDNVTYTLLATLAPTTTDYTDTTASANQQYYYQAEYYNSLNGAVSAVKRTGGPCTTAATACGSNFPLHEFEFDTSSSNCDTLIISDLFNDDTSFKIPDQYACFNIASIQSIILTTWDNCYSTEANATTVNISTTVANYNTLTKDIEVALGQGIHKVKLTVTYTDTFGASKTITQEQCVFICGTLKCNLAKMLANDIENKDIAPIYYSLEFMADCGQCASACETYQYLLNYGTGCC